MMAKAQQYQEAIANQKTQEQIEAKSKLEKKKVDKEMRKEELISKILIGKLSKPQEEIDWKKVKQSK